MKQPLYYTTATLTKTRILIEFDIVMLNKFLFCSSKAGIAHNSGCGQWTKRPVSLTFSVRGIFSGFIFVSFTVIECTVKKVVYKK